MLRLVRIPHFWLLIFLLAVLLLMAGGRVAPLDDETTYRMTANLLDGRLTITNQIVTFSAQTYPGFLPARSHTFITTWSGPGLDGEIYPQYTHAQSLFEIPLYLAGRMLGGDAVTLSSVELTKFTTSLLSPILIALIGWLVAVFAGRLGLSHRLSVCLGLAAALATMALPYIDTNYSEPLLTLVLLAATYAIYRARFDDRWRYVLGAGAGLGLVLYTRERSLIYLPPFFLYFFLTQPRRQWRRWLVFLIPIGLAGGLIGAWNWIRFGSPLITSYAAWQPETGFGTPIIVGVYGLWLSAGKGLLIYNPIGWLGLVGLIPLWQRDRSLAALIGLLLLIPTLFFARYDLWTGGWNWGPRYLLPLVPLLVLTAGVWVHDRPARFRRGVLIGVCLLGLILNGPAVLVDHSRYFTEAGERDPDHYLTRTTLLFDASPITQQWPTVFEVARLLQQPEAWTAARQIVDQHLQTAAAGNNLESISAELLWVDEFLRLNLPAPWFFRLWLLGFYPAWVIGLAVSALLLLLIVAGYKLFRNLRSGMPTVVSRG